MTSDCRKGAQIMKAIWVGKGDLLFYTAAREWYAHLKQKHLAQGSQQIQAT